MPKRIYQLGEPCDYCRTPTIQGPTGIYCKPCYIAYKNRQNAMPPAVNGNAPRNPISTNQNYPAPQPYQTPESVSRQEFIAFANNVKTTIQKLSDKVHALEMVKMFQDEKPAREFHEATAPKIPLMANDQEINTDEIFN